MLMVMVMVTIAYYYRVLAPILGHSRQCVQLQSVSLRREPLSLANGCFGPSVLPIAAFVR